MAGTIRVRSFPPVAGPKTRVLILGSLPGAESLRQSRYYAHPRNQFWLLIGDVVGVDLQGLAYENRLEALLKAGVGLWDVVSAAARVGSLDSAIRDHRTNDLERFHKELPSLAAIGFNGGKSAALGTPLLAGAGVPLIQLPSSSPAYTRSLDSKRDVWRALRRYL